MVDNTAYCYHKSAEEEFVPVEVEPTFDSEELRRNVIFPDPACYGASQTLQITPSYMHLLVCMHCALCLEIDIANIQK